MPRHNPYVVKPEFVRGCTMRCVFCGLRHQKWAEWDWEYIDPALFERYCKDLGEWLPKCRMEIANRGEETYHPQFMDMIRIAKKYVPKVQIMVTTNTDLTRIYGAEGFREWVQKAMDAGVNVFLLDCYTKKRLSEITEAFQGMFSTYFENDLGEGAEHVTPYGYRGPNYKAIVIKDASPAPKESILLQYHNQGNNANTSDNPNALRMYPNVSTPKEPVQRMCVRPFREFPMWYDGSVPICCDDWGDKHIIGKFPDMTLPELWDAYDFSRRNLLNKDRDANGEPCRFCTERSGFRWGLEKDWFEKEAKNVKRPSSD